MSACQGDASKCACTYPGCPRKGNCCQCVSYHRSKGELTACFFSPEAERTYDRSRANYIRDCAGSRSGGIA